MQRLASGFVVALWLNWTCSVYGQDPANILRESSRALTRIQENRQNGIPQSILERANCIGVIPAIRKGALLLQASGRGVLSCSTRKGWSAPFFIRTEGGSFAIASADQTTVFLVMNTKTRDRLATSSFKIGADAAAAAGPVGRDVSGQTDAFMHAGILSYSLSRGVFAGASLEGMSIRPDNQLNGKVYGLSTTSRAILNGEIPTPVSFQVPPFPPIPPPPPPPPK